MGIRAIRGAVQLTVDSKDEMHREVPALLQEMLSSNNLTQDDVISALFTATPDITGEFPAAAARSSGWGDTPLMCSVEIAVPGSLPRTVRVILHVESDLRKHEISHIYRGGAKALRPDLGP